MSLISRWAASLSGDDSGRASIKEIRRFMISVVADPIFNMQPSVIHKVRFVVSDQFHTLSDRMRCDDFVQGISVAIFVGCADGAIGLGGLCLKRRNLDVVEQALYCRPVGFQCRSA